MEFLQEVLEIIAVGLCLWVCRVFLGFSFPLQYYLADDQKRTQHKHP